MQMESRGSGERGLESFVKKRRVKRGGRGDGGDEMSEE